MKKSNIMKERSNPNPLVSIITIVYNNEEHLNQTIQSVYLQNYPNIEYLIIDGGSTDGTIDIIKENEDKIDYWISEKDEGISDAFNKGLEIAKGDLIGIINSDDWYEEDAIQKILSNEQVIQNLDKPMVVYGKTYRVTQEGKRVEKKSSKMGWHVSVPFSHCSSFVTKEYYKQFGFFNKEFKIAMDIDLLIRGLKNAYYLELPFFIANQRDGGVSEKSRLLGYREYFNIAKKKLGYFMALVGYFYKLLVYYLKS